MKKSVSPTIRVSKASVLASLNQKFLDLAERGFLDAETVQSVLSSNAAIVDSHFAAIEAEPPRERNHEVYSDLSVDDVPPLNKSKPVRFDPSWSMRNPKEATSLPAESEQRSLAENHKAQNGVNSKVLSFVNDDAFPNKAQQSRGRSLERQRGTEKRSMKLSSSSSPLMKILSNTSASSAGMERAQLRLLMPEDRRSRSEERKTWYDSLRSS